MDFRPSLLLLILTLNFTVVNQASAKAQDLFELAEPSFIPMDTGTAEVTVSNVAQSASGLIWLATGSGVIQYDGYDFKAMDYFNAEGKRLEQQYIFSIRSGANGVMWAGTALKGLIRIDERRKQFEVYVHDPDNPSSLVDNRVFDVLPDGDRGLWLATKSGLDYFDIALSEFQHHPLPEVSNKLVRSISRGADGTLLLGTLDGLYQYDIDRRKSLLLTADRSVDLKGQMVRTITPDNDGRVWIGTKFSGAYLLHADGSLQKLGKYHRIFSIQILGDEVWMATNNHGVAVFDYKTGQAKREYTADPYRPLALGNNLISNLFLDQSGVLWLSGWGTGIWTVTPAREYARTLLYSPAKQVPSLKVDVSGVLETDSGEIWVSSLSQGIDVFDPQKGFQRGINTEDNSVLDLPSNKITRFFKTRDGNVWIGTADAGLHRYRQNDSVLPGGVATWSRDQCRFEGDQDKLFVVSRFKQLADDTVLVFSSEGLFQTKSPQQLSCNLTPIAVDSGHAPRFGIEINDHTTLITDYTALNILERGEDKTTRIKLRVKGVEAGKEPQITGGYGMKSGRIFLSSTNKLYLVTGFSDGILDIEKIHTQDRGSWLYNEDEDGNVWGVGSYWLAKNDAVKALTPADGFIFEAGYGVDFVRTSDDLLVIAQQLGLNVRKTSAFTEWKFQPPMIITGITVDEQPYQKERDLVVLESDNQDFSVSFAALDYSGSKLLLYRYLLEGYSSAWVNADASERRATFTNLAPGKYVFRLQSSNRAGEWSDLELELPVTVLPPWYQTWIFRAAMLVLFMALLYALYLWRLGYYRAKKVELEGLVRDRTADLAQSMENLKSTQEKLIVSEKQASLGRLVSGVAHEINTPLGIARMACSTAESSVAELFQAFSINTIQDKPVLSRYKKYIASTGLIDSSLSRLSNLVDSFKKISVNEDEWRFQWFELDELLSIMLVVQQEEAQTKNVQIKLDVEEGLKIFSCREIIQNVAAELTNNSLLHGFVGSDSGLMTIRAYLEKTSSDGEKHFVLEVKDDGVGMGGEFMKTLFDPFTAKETSNLGLGLHVVVNLVSSVLHGEISCESEQGQGSCFTVRIPIIEPPPTS